VDGKQSKVGGKGIGTDRGQPGPLPLCPLLVCETAPNVEVSLADGSW
jgi:hypothetical protein